MNRVQSYAFIVALAGAALVAFCAYAFSAPVDMSNVIVASLVDLRTFGFLLGLAALVGGALCWLCAK
ncbi:MAG: hypothetical protein WAW96_04785 [Alphaproteobacteria bacterium]